MRQNKRRNAKTEHDGIKKERRQKMIRIRFRGSFTVEAVFLYPILVLLIAFMITLSMNWYEKVDQAAGDTEELRELDTRSYFLENITQILSRSTEGRDGTG